MSPLKKHGASSSSSNSDSSSSVRQRGKTGGRRVQATDAQARRRLSAGDRDRRRFSRSNSPRSRRQVAHRIDDHRPSTRNGVKEEERNRDAAAKRPVRPRSRTPPRLRTGVREGSLPPPARRGGDDRRANIAPVAGATEKITPRPADLNARRRPVEFEPIDRNSTAPFLLRVFAGLGAFHPNEAFASAKQLPGDSELQVYTWLNASLRELVDLIKDVSPEARHRQARFSFRAVNWDLLGTPHFRPLGEVHSTIRDARDNTTLEYARFAIGDVIDLALHVPLPGAPRGRFGKEEEADFTATSPLGTAAGDGAPMDVPAEADAGENACSPSVEEVTQEDQDPSTAAPGGEEGAASERAHEEQKKALEAESSKRLLKSETAAQA